MTAPPNILRLVKEMRQSAEIKDRTSLNRQKCSFQSPKMF